MTTKAELAQAAHTEANGDTGKAASLLYDRIMSDHVLRAEFIEPLVREWCADLIAAECVRKPRAAVWSEAVNHGSNRRARAVVRSLLDFPLPGGKPLHLATRAEVSDAADFYTRQAEDMAWKARWLTRIAGGMGRKRTVGAAFDADGLQALYDETCVGHFSGVTHGSSAHA